MSKSENPLHDYAETECSVHFAATNIEPESFPGFEGALNHVRRHLSASYAAMVVVHDGTEDEPSYSGEELAPIIMAG